MASTIGVGAGPGRSVSVVIPTLNEASRLPVLLDDLTAQTRLPGEIVVADAASADGTADIARARGAKVVDGGSASVGRNRGAAAARGDIIVFMDADAELEPTFLESALGEFEQRGLGVATTPMRALVGEPQYRFWFAFVDLYMRALQHISPHAVGLCIIVDRAVHQQCGGFDESIVLGEDHDYARRAARIGRFGVLRSVKARTSMRRVQREGALQTARVLIWSEWQTLHGRPIREIPFEYEFGNFSECDEEARP